MTVSAICKALESLAPRGYQESYDNAQLITGQPEQEVTGILCCLDSTEAIIDEAIAKNCNMVVAHHPIVFSGLKSLTGKHYVERVIIKAIKNDIAIYAIHTNLDNVRQGVNEEMADRLGLINRSILIPKSGQLQKLEVYCPAASLNLVRDAMFEAGAGHIGQYDQCSYSSEGIGTFRPLEGANPTVGGIGQLSQEEEVRLDVLVPAVHSRAVIAAMKAAHPYEEVAHQLIQLENSHQGIGAGLLGELEEPQDSLAFLKQVKEIFGVGAMRHTAIVKDQVKRIAVLGGSGSFGIGPAKAQGADVLITADVKYHEFFEADGQLLLASIGHYESEQYTSQLLQGFLSKKFPKFAVLLTEHNTNPVNYL